VHFVGSYYIGIKIRL